MDKTVISAEALGRPNRGYSHGVRVGDLLFIAGQIPMDREGRITVRDFRAQAVQVFENIKEVLAQAGASLDNLVKLNSYMINMDMNYNVYKEVRSQYLKGDQLPASTLVEVSSLVPRDALLEIEAIAVLPM